MRERDLELLRISLFDTRPLSRGREVKLSVATGPNQGEYGLRVEGADRNTIYLTLPEAGGEVIRLHPGTEVTLSVRTSDGVYRFASVVRDLPDDTQHQLALVLPAEAQRLQRRRHLRAAVDLPVTVSRLPGKGEPLAALRAYAARTGNLSEGGLSFTCPSLKLAPGDLVALSMALPGSRRTLRATCEVLRVETEPAAYAVRFADLDERMGAELTAFLERRRRERLNRAPLALGRPGSPDESGGRKR